MKRRLTLATARRIFRDARGLAATEFAIILPLLLSLGLTGLELANRAIVQMQINQLAAQVADNASRIGETSQLQARRIHESDIHDLLLGAHLQAGEHLDLYGRGRVIISSQEVVPDTADEQYIHWQRCMGEKRVTSRYGGEGTGLNEAFAGMGPPGEEVLAFAGEAVMFVEIEYDYRPLIGNPFGAPATIRSIASFAVRDHRDLSQIHQRDPAAPSPVADCDTFSGLAA